MNKTVLLAVCLVVLCSYCVNGMVKDCGGKADIVSVTCSGVDMKTATAPCPLKKGTNATLELKFTPAIAATKLKAVCHGYVSGIPVPFTGIDSDGCHGLKPGCPLKQKVQQTYRTSIPVEKIYPSLQVAIKWELVVNDSNDDQDVLCLIIPAILE